MRCKTTARIAELPSTCGLRGGIGLRAPRIISWTRSAVSHERTMLRGCDCARLVLCAMLLCVPHAENASRRPRSRHDGHTSFRLPTRRQTHRNDDCATRPLPAAVDDSTAKLDDGEATTRASDGSQTDGTSHAYDGSQTYDATQTYDGSQPHDGSRTYGASLTHDASQTHGASQACNGSRAHAASRPYDGSGAMKFALVVIGLYGASITLMIGTSLRTRHRDEDDVKLFLKTFASIDTSRRSVVASKRSLRHYLRPSRPTALPLATAASP